MNDVAKFYDLLIDKTQAERLVWKPEPASGSFVTRVSGNVLRIWTEGMTATLVRGLAFNLPRIVMFDDSGVMVGEGFGSTFAGLNKRPNMVDLSNPKLSELANLLDGRFNPTEALAAAVEDLESL